MSYSEYESEKKLRNGAPRRQSSGYYRRGSEASMKAGQDKFKKLYVT